MGLTVGYMSASRAQQDISRFLMPGYNLQRPYQFNGGPPPAVAGGELESTCSSGYAD
jgi:putative transposase